LFEIKKKLAFIGLMSGTSMDGINCTLVYTNGQDLETTSFNAIIGYSTRTQALLNKAIDSIDLYKKIKKFKKSLDVSVTLDHAKIIQKLIVKSKIKPDFIGFHGQTIFHNPDKKESIQAGLPQLLSNMLQIKVISDFRDNDIDNGGQGAPISPIYHKYLIQKHNLELPTCFLNIGGISNFTYWDGELLIGFDLGPGNCLMDIYIQKHLNKKFDNFGELASKGKINTKILRFFLKDNYFLKSYPKSLDKNYFTKNLAYEGFLKLSHEDAMATLAEFTIQSIKLSIDHLPKNPRLIVIMGGGMNNKYLVNRISDILSCDVLLANQINLSGEMIEAELIGYLSARFVYNLPITFPLTTGVKKSVSGGKLYVPKNKKNIKYNWD